MTPVTVSSSEEFFLSKTMTTSVLRRAGGQAEHPESVLRSREKRWCCNKSKSSECCEHERFEKNR
jgi:hypothetical protein